MKRLVASFVLVILGSTAARAADYEVDCRLGQGDPKGNRAAGTLKVVSAPNLVVKSGEAASVLVGGQLPIGGQYVPVGREVEITATARDNGAIRVKVVLKVHTKVGGGAAPQVSTVSQETTATIQPGEMVRVEIGNDPKDRQWADVTVRKMK